MRTILKAAGSHPKTFVETGCWKGITVGRVMGEAQTFSERLFDHAYSIEMNGARYRQCRRKFNHRADITMIYGDSRVELPKLIKELPDPVCFWLDAHKCGRDTAGDNDNPPTCDELDIVLARVVPGDIVAIDDINEEKQQYSLRSPLAPLIEKIDSFGRPREVLFFSSENGQREGEVMVITCPG